MRQFKPDPESNILVVGDLILDRYVHGNTSRISPEAPVPVVHVQKTEERPGGAANVALNIRHLGVSVSLIGVTGKDESADVLERELSAHDIQCDFSRQASFPTIAKLRVLSQHQQLLRLDYEGESNKIDSNAILNLYLNQIDAADIVVLSDYAKGSLANVEEIIRIAGEKQKFILIDPKGNDFERYKKADLLTPNLKEFESIVGKCSDQNAIIEKGQQLRDELQLTALMITQGEHGMTLIEKEGEAHHLEAAALEVFDVTGAGDTVIATLSAAKASGYALKDAMYFANKAAGLVVSKLGAASVTTEELNHALNPLHDNKELDEEALLKKIITHKENGEKIVMTNGCFDILHSGHAYCLKAAKAMGDILIVAVNDDESVRKLKGSDRPLNSIDDRLEVLSSLEVVDYVIAFSEQTPERLIKLINPDVLAKGGDYKVSEIAGSDFVLEQGGQVELIPLRENRSTTNLISRIRDEERK